MAKHSFIVELEVSDDNKEEVSNYLYALISGWLDNIAFLTKQTERVVQIKPISRITTKQETLERIEENAEYLETTEGDEIKAISTENMEGLLEDMSIRVLNPETKIEDNGNTTNNSSELASTLGEVIQRPKDGDDKESDTP